MVYYLYKQVCVFNDNVSAPLTHRPHTPQTIFFVFRCDSSSIKAPHIPSFEISEMAQHRGGGASLVAFTADQPCFLPPHPPLYILLAQALHKSTSVFPPHLTCRQPIRVSRVGASWRLAKTRTGKDQSRRPELTCWAGVL